LVKCEPSGAVLDMNSGKYAVFIATIVVLCLTIIFSGFSNVARLQGIKSDKKLFPNEFAVKDVLIAPVDRVYGTWVFIYIYQVCWMCYGVSLILRSNAPDLLDKKFFGSYSIALICNIIWLFTWSRQMHGLGFVFYVLQAVFLNASLYFAFASSDEYFQPSPSVVLSSFDFWSFRLLLINGVSFFTGWVSATALVSFAAVLQADLGVAQASASNAALSLLLVFILLWSALQNFVWERHTRLVFAEYISVIVVLAGVIAKEWSYKHEEVRSYSLVLFIITFMLAIFRFGLVIKEEAKRGTFPLTHHERGEDVKLI